MLAKLFGYRVELVEHSEELTLVKADTAVPVGTRIPVRVSGANGRRTPSVPMVVVSCRPAEHGGFLLAGKFLVDHPDLTGIELPPSFNDSFARSAPRITCHLCVLSRDLPGFRVMTVDLSEGGLQVEAGSAVTVGSSVLLRIELDTDMLAPIEAMATVAWCSQSERSKYRVGLQFTSLNEAARQNIGRYRELLARRESVDIGTRTSIGDQSIEWEGLAQPPVAEMPTLKTEDWKPVPLLQGAILVGYMRAGSQLQVRFRAARPGGGAREYVFTGLKGLKDNLEGDPTAREIGRFRYTSANETYHRFQLLDERGVVLLEIHAEACRETSPETN